MLHHVPYGSARTWSFIATPQSRLLSVYCTVMYPKDITQREIEVRTREAGAVFAAIVQRLALRPSDAGRPAGFRCRTRNGSV